MHVSEDSPITLQLAGKKVSGFCQNCEEFFIFVVLEEFVGNSLMSAHISVEPWRLLKRLYGKLDEITSEDKIVNRLIKNEGTLSKDKSISDIVMDQDKAFYKALNNDITVIWGPPGTGKTYTMAHIAMEFLMLNKSVLMVSHSNVSVDGMILELYDQILKSRYTALHGFINRGKILRFGHVINEELLSNNDVVAYNYVLKIHGELSKRLKKLLKQKENLQKYDSKIEVIDKEIKKIKNEIKEYEVESVGKARLVATTISKVSMHSFFENRKYDVVMFDEASMAYIPHIFEAAAIARQHFICVGDFRQLPPICQSEAKDELGKDIFNYLGICDEKGHLYYHSWMVMLNEQRRMYPDISRFSSHNIYEDLLKDFKTVEKARKNIVDSLPFQNNALALVDLSGTNCITGKTADNSRFNILSAMFAFQIAVDALENGNKNIGIITPYQAQCRLIQSLLYDYKDEIGNKIVCSTIHQFQGSEKDIIIFDSVESYPYSRPGIIMSENNGDNLLRLINVAITRARGKLIVLSNQQFWKDTVKKKNLFYDLTCYIEENGKVLKYADGTLEQYFNSLKASYHKEKPKKYYKVFRYYNDMCMDRFDADLQKARERVIVSIPDGNLNQANQSEVMFMLNKLKDKGIDVIGKTNDYDNLDLEWKKMIWESNEIVFPIVLIDDKILWYGLPKSKGLMRGNGKLIVSPCENYFRISAKKTLEFIISNTNIQNRIVDNFSKLLSVKHLYDEDSSKQKNKNLDGLAAYVYENKRCPKCSSPLKLAKGRKVFLKCSECDYHTYLDKDTVEDYIDKNDVVCPRHHCGLRVGIGRTGLYVLCDRGEFIKIEDL